MSARRRVIILFILAAIGLAAYFTGPALYRAIMLKPPSVAGTAGSGATPPELAAQSVQRPLTDPKVLTIADILRSKPY